MHTLSELFLAKICFFPQDMAPDIKSSWHETFACLARNETFRAFACLALACTHCTSNHCLSSKTQTSLIKLPKHSSCPTCSRHPYFWHHFSFRDSTITFIGEVLKTLTKHTNSSFSLVTFCLSNDLFQLYKWRASVCDRRPTDCFQILTEETQNLAFAKKWGWWWLGLLTILGNMYLTILGNILLVNAGKNGIICSKTDSRVWPLRPNRWVCSIHLWERWE